MLFTRDLYRYGADLLDALTRWACTSLMQLTHSLKAPDFNP
jgi:hypothetical protein